MLRFWFEVAKLTSTCFRCRKKIYKHEARCKFENGQYGSWIFIRFLCIKCANKELRRIKKELESAKAHQRKHKKDIINEKVLEGL